MKRYRVDWDCGTIEADVNGEWVKYYETAVYLEVLCGVAIKYIASPGLKEACVQELNKILGEGGE